MLLGLLVLALMVVVLSVSVGARAALSHARRPRRRSQPVRREVSYDPGRERRAEQRARELLRSCVNDEEWGMYRDLGFIRVDGRVPATSSRALALRSAASHASGSRAPYAYLIYPHRPIVAYVPEDGRLLSEYCVEFPDLAGEGRTRLPASDDVLAKWMALTSDESRVIGQANMHLVGRQHDPARLRRDLWRLGEWERRRAGQVTQRAPEA
jgi:hypothetical protein